VEECRRRFAEVFAQGTNEEKRDSARLFVQRIEVDPDTGDVLMHLHSRPPVPVSRGGHKRTPASAEMGVRIGMVAGAVFVPDSHSEMLPSVAAHWVYAPAYQGAREMRRIGLAT
jgi:hypothetical protein